MASARCRARARLVRLGLLALPLVLAGCASVSPDPGFGDVQAAARAHLGRELAWTREPAEREALRAQVGALLARPLSVDDAVQVALLNNRGLQAAFAELGIAHAELLRASRPANPHVSLLNASRAHDGVREFKIEQAFLVNLVSVFTLPQAVAIEERRLAQARQAAILTVLQLAAETRKAWYQAVAAEEIATYRRQVSEAAAVGAELAARMARAGNWNALDQAREHRFSAEAALGEARAQLERRQARERLIRLLGLWGEDTGFTLPQRLPALPAEPADRPELEQQAMGRRIDLLMARLEIEAQARQLGLTRSSRFINVLELGPARVLEGERSAGYKRGVEVSFELPLFDQGGARLARAQALHQQSLERAAQAAIEARSQVREAYDALRTRWDIARHHRDELLPISRRIADENLLRYNGMFIGVFELLADARAQIASVMEAIEANRDFWLAQSDLDMALLGPTGKGNP
jgi:outer membrane protein TolC